MVEDQELLRQQEHSTRKQLRYARLQCILTGIAALCCVGFLILACILFVQAQELMAQLEPLITDLKSITQELSNTGLTDLIQNINELTSDSQSALDQSVNKLNSLDIHALNQAIRDLAAIVKPLADFFNVF